MGQETPAFQQEFIVRWVTTFYDQVEANARTDNGLVHDLQENLKLGGIIKGLQVAI
jgi:hypothetical protein